LSTLYERLPSTAAGFRGRLGNDPANNGDVYARRFDAAGAPLGAQFRVNTTTSNTQDE